LGRLRALSLPIALPETRRSLWLAEQPTFVYTRSRPGADRHDWLLRDASVRSQARESHARRRGRLLGRRRPAPSRTHRLARDIRRFARRALSRCGPGFPDRSQRELDLRRGLR